LVLFFIQKTSVVELPGATFMIGSLEENFSSKKSINFVFEEKESLVKVLSLFALDDDGVFAFKLVDEVEKDIFMLEQFL
jgi:hypothetical protein